MAPLDFGNCHLNNEAINLENICSMPNVDVGSTNKYFGFNDVLYIKLEYMINCDAFQLRYIHSSEYDVRGRTYICLCTWRHALCTWSNDYRKHLILNNIYNILTHIWLQSRCAAIVKPSAADETFINKSLSNSNSLLRWRLLVYAI